MGAQKIGRLDYAVNGKRAGNNGEDIFCSSLKNVIPVTWKTWRSVDILLISIPSTFHYEALLDGMFRHGFDYRGKTKVIIGGFAAINPFLLLGYFDFWVWGRARDVSSEILDAAMSGSTLDYGAHQWEIEGGVNKIIRQEPQYNGENLIGCPYKCKFCQYAHIRPYQKIGKRAYEQGNITDGKSPEVMMRDICSMTSKPGRLRSGLDGSSESIRYKYGKKISNKDIEDAILHLGNLAHGDTAVVLTLYTINNFPGETQSDRDELERVFLDMPEPYGRVIVVLCGLGFRPMPLTPMQYEPAGIFPSMVPTRQKVVRDTLNLRVTWSYTLEGPLSTLRNVIVERCNMDVIGAVRSAILRSVSVDSDRAARSMIKSFGLSELIGETNSLPTDFLSVGKL